MGTLTGLRGWAALWVLAYHLDRFHLMGPSRLAQRGYLGVELFFALSAWVLLLHYGMDWPGWGEFLRRRLARLLPLYYLSHALMLALWVLARSQGLAPADPLYGDPQHALATVLLLQAWGVTGALAWNSTAWSVSAEWGAYLLLLPLWRLARGRWAWGLALLALAWGLELGGAAALGRRSLGFDVWGGLRVLGPFSLGALLWQHARGLRPAWGDAWAGAALTALGLLVYGTPPGPADAAVAAWAGVLVMGLAAQGPLARALAGAAPLRWLGRASYSFYLLQLPLLAVLTLWCRPALARLPQPLPAVAAAALLAGLAGASWRWLERPAQRWMLAHLKL